MLKINNLHKSFRGVVALDGVSLEVSTGEIVSIVGDNGAGKSTLMKCISGNLKPDSGAVVFYAQDISGKTPRECQKLGIEMVYQDLALCKQQDVVANMFLGKEITKGFFLDKKGMRQQAEMIFAKLEITLPMNIPVETLSGGQQQIIAISRAMLSSPKLLILDEPTAALGVKESKKVLDYIQKVKEQGVSVLMISHNLPDVFEVSDSIVVMKQGEIKYLLTPEETNLKDLVAKIAGD